MADSVSTPTQRGAHTHSREDAQDGAFKTEHTLAWLMALTAIALAAVGLLTGFGILGSDDVPGQVTGAADTAARTNWQEGLIWLLPGIAAGLLAQALHGNEHHARRLPADGSGKGSFGAEHAIAYIAALATIAAGVLAILVGFDVFDRGNAVEDGFLWATASIIGGLVTTTVHNVRHHQMAADEDYIVSVVESRSAPERMRTQRAP